MDDVDDGNSKNRMQESMEGHTRQGQPRKQSRPHERQDEEAQSVHVEVTLEDAFLQRVVLDDIDAGAALEVCGVVRGGFDVFWERHC